MKKADVMRRPSILYTHVESGPASLGAEGGGLGVRRFDLPDRLRQHPDGRC